jgi:hypothetical protein
MFFDSSLPDMVGPVISVRRASHLHVLPQGVARRVVRKPCFGDPVGAAAEAVARSGPRLWTQSLPVNTNTPLACYIGWLSSRSDRSHWYKAMAVS